MSQSTFASALTRGFAIYLGKVNVTTNFSIESSPRHSTFTVANSVKDGDKNDDIKIGGFSCKNKKNTLTMELKRNKKTNINCCLIDFLLNNAIALLKPEFSSFFNNKKLGL